MDVETARLWQEPEHMLKTPDGNAVEPAEFEAMLAALKAKKPEPEATAEIWTAEELADLRELERLRKGPKPGAIEWESAYRKTAEREQGVTVRTAQLSDKTVVEFRLERRRGLEMRVLKGSRDMNEWTLPERKRYLAARAALCKTASVRCGRALFNW